jgi:hypothetical protein
MGEFCFGGMSGVEAAGCDEESESFVFRRFEERGMGQCALKQQQLWWWEEEANRSIEKTTEEIPQVVRER